MATLCDFSFLDNPGALGNYAAHSAFDMNADVNLPPLNDLDFQFADVENPATFCADVKASGEAKGLMDFKRGTTTLAFKFKHGIIVAVDARASMGSYIGSQTVKKVIEINDFLLGTMAGGAADCSFWERHLARLCRIWELRNKERISVAAASNLLAGIFFQYRGMGLSCGTMVAGWDRTGPQLYMVDDRGDRLTADKFSVGSGSTFAYGVLDTGYKYDLSVEEACELGKKAIYHATHRDGASGGVVRVYHIHEKGWTKLVAGQDVNELHYQYAEERGMRGDE